MSDVRLKMLSDFKNKLNEYGNAQVLRVRFEDAKKVKEDKQRKDDIDQAVRDALVAAQVAQPDVVASVPTRGGLFGYFAQG
jgi:hypothetical protein